MIRLAPLTAAIALLAASAASAQTTPPGAEGLSQVPLASPGGARDTTGSIASSGRVRPPGAPVGDGLGTSPDLEEKSREIDRQAAKGICKGCD